MQPVSSAVNHPYNLLPFFTGTVILFLPRKVEGWNSSNWNCLIVLEDGYNPLNHVRKFGFILYLWWFYEERDHSYFGITPQYYLTLVCHFQYFVVLECAQHSCKICWSPLWFFTCHFINQNNSTDWSPHWGELCWMIGRSHDNASANKSLNEIFNCCLWLVLDWMDILGVVCGTWCGLSEISPIVWSKATSYFQFYSLDIIVSQVVSKSTS